MNIEKQAAGTEYAFANRFYPVGNLRGFSWAPIQTTQQMNHNLPIPALQLAPKVPSNEKRMYTIRKRKR